MNGYALNIALWMALFAVFACSQAVLAADMSQPARSVKWDYCDHSLEVTGTGTHYVVDIPANGNAILVWERMK